MGTKMMNPVRFLVYCMNKEVFMREYRDIEVEKKNDSLDREKLTHPAFGMVGFSRIQGGNPVLFGSSVEHNDRIQLTIKHAEEYRGLSKDWYHGRGMITQVEMSYSQFAECVSAMNMGDGVPCTIMFTEKDGMIPGITKNVDKRQQFRDEFSERIDRAMETVQEQIDVIRQSLENKKNFGIKDRENLMKALNSVKVNIGSNLDFVVESFDEQMDKSVCEAKGEIEAFCQNKMAAFAQMAISEHSDEIKKLENPVIKFEE